VLPCVAVCCGVLPCIAVCCRELTCVAVCCSVLQCVAVSAAYEREKRCVVCSSVLQPKPKTEPLHLDLNPKL